MEAQLERVFLSHSSRDRVLAVAIAAALQKCIPGGVFYYEGAHAPDFAKELNKQIVTCTHMMVLLGDKSEESGWQEDEVNSFRAWAADSRLRFVVDCRSERQANLPERYSMLQQVAKWPPSAEDPPVPSPRPGSKDPGLLEATYRTALEIAHEAARTWRFPWRGGDGLPADPHLFEYEKDIIDFYTRIGSSIDELSEDDQRILLDGAPQSWPLIRTECTALEAPHTNTDDLKELVGEWRDRGAVVLAAALSKYHDPDERVPTSAGCPLRKGLSFPEAGPRKEHVFPGRENDLNVGILVSGGIAPGINAVIDGITGRHHLYADSNHYTVEVRGLLNGFHSLENAPTWVTLVPDRKGVEAAGSICTADFASAGGAMLGTSRVDSLLKPGIREAVLQQIVNQARASRLDILYVIGGDGSMKAAHAIWNYARDTPPGPGQRPLSVVGIPKTMDNDILWVWQSFGFLSAVEKAREIIQDLHTEVSSNPRLCVAQLFGSVSGFVVSHAVLASQTGTCDAALIPEVPFRMDKLAAFVMERMATRKPNRGGRIPSALIVMAETAIPKDALDYVDVDAIGLLPQEKKALREFDALRNKGRRAQGQTDEWLRSAGLKIVSRGLEYLIRPDSPGGPQRVSITGKFAKPDWELLRVFTNEPRHLLRAIPPSCMDIISGQRMGALAVDNALAGYTDFMLSQWLTEFVLVPLELVVLGRKRIPRTGVFWRSVKAKTGQPNLV